jgi:uncharacterized protein (DUF362 family)
VAAKEKPVQHPDYEKAPLDRRTFVKRAATSLGIGAAASYMLLAPEDWPGSLRDESGLRSKPRVRPLTLDDFRVERPSSASDVGVGRGANTEERLRAALDAVGGLAHYVDPGDIVLLKPNVAFDRSPNLGATTDPEIVELLVRLLLVDCRAQEVRVADNPIESPADCFAKSGIRRAVERAGGRIYLPDGNAFKILHTENAELIENWLFFHRPLTNVDKVIGVAPVKDHNLCRASLGLKNWYGLLGGRRNQFHQNIHGIISDLSIMMRPTLSILDGGRVLMRNGPTGGDPSDVKAADAVVAGVDPVAVDAWAYEHLLERGREYPGYLHRAEEKGGGKVDYSGRVGGQA